MKKKKDIYLNKKLQTRHSAGGILINDKAEILFCHPTNSNWNNWRMPKGQVDGNDSILDTAIREVYEETGFECDIIQEIKTKPVKKSFFWKKNKKFLCFKMLHFFLMDPVIKSGNPDFENDSFIWVPIEKYHKYADEWEVQCIEEAIEIYLEIESNGDLE